MFTPLVLCLLAACGGGADDIDSEPTTLALGTQTVATAAAEAASASDATSATSAANAASTTTAARDAAGKADNTEATQAIAGTLGKASVALGDRASTTGALRRAALFTQLNGATTSPAAGLRAIGPSAACREGFVPPADLVRSTAAAAPPAGAVFFTAAELAAWRSRVKSGPFIADADFAPASPGDWNRIRANADRFIANGEPLATDDDATRSTHGQLARDAAFVYLMNGNSRALGSVRSWLLQQAAAPGNDFATRRCYVAADGGSRDGYFAEAPWLARFVATYDFVRTGISARERVTIENFIRRNAWFFATQLDWGLRMLFPQRLAGNYSQRGESAAATGDAIWWTRRGDSNGDCTVDGRDDPRALPVYTHTGADGRLGNAVPWLALWFNNRRAANALAAGAAGVLLGDADLAERAKRYTMEWLTWGVFADGSTAEYGRNGEYCVARQGLVYGAMNVQSGVMLGRLLARQGDRSLVEFSTHEGRYGTESATTPKTLALTAQTLLAASSGALAWFQAEPWRGTQQPRAATALGSPRIRYQGSATMDTMHELSLLTSAASLAGVAVADSLLKHPLITRSPAAAAGVPVATGLGQWSDALGILPAAYLLRP